MLCQHVYDCHSFLILFFARMVHYTGFVRRRVETFHSKEMTMSDENRVNLEQIHNGFMDISEHCTNPEFLDSSSPDVKYSDNVFPWLIKFNKVMSSSVGCRSSQLLEHLLSLYTENIITSINIYYEKALDMIKLKNHISSTLTYFHLYWHDIKEFVDDSEPYLNAMSVLLGIYIDMELKTSRHTKDSTSLVAKLFSALWIYLNHSEKHIFRVLLKLKHCTKKSIKICEPMIMKSFKCMRRNGEEMWTDIEYVRYLLMLKVWKRMKESLREIKEVNKMALAILGPHVPEMRDELLKIIPKPPVGHGNETLWLLQPNVFDLRKACSNFLAFEDSITIQSNKSYLLKKSDLNIFQQSQIVSSCGINAVREHSMNFELNKCETNKLKNTLDHSKFADQALSTKRRNKFKKFRQASKLKSGEIILIDLTEDNESLEANKNKKKKKKCKRKLDWLKMMRKKYRVQKPVEVNCRNEVEIADAHSTENSKSFVDKSHLEYLPISDNKVSESTESYTTAEEELSFQDHARVNSQCIHDYISNKRTKELKCEFQHNQRDICTLLLKQNDIQYNRILFLLKFLNAVDQNIKEPKAILNLFRENTVSSQHTFACKSTTNKSREINIQEETFSQPNSSIHFKECQERIMNSQSIKQELPTSTDCNVAEADNIYCQNKSVCVQNDRHSRDFRSSSICSQISETIKQKLSDSHECVCSTKKIDVKPFASHTYNIVNTAKNEDTVQTAVDDNSTDKKSSICDKNIICMLSDLDKCMDVLNRISEHIVTVHAEKQRLECSDKSDVCAVSTTVSRDQSVKSSLGWAQNSNLTNSEKLSKILELYGKKELLNACNCKDSHRWDNQETNIVSNQLKSESDDCKKFLVSLSQPKDTYFREKTQHTLSGNKLSDNFVSDHVKSDFEQLVKAENIEVFESATNQSEKANERKLPVAVNSEAHANEYFPYDLKSFETLNENVHCDSVLQSLLQKNDTTKAQSVEKFENIDILDSILNGSITMEDEQEMLEESQSSLMSPISYDNSNNVLNCITEFFLQAKNTYGTDKEDKYAMPDAKNSGTPLPEGSLGITGILNFLLDFELTNMSFLPNDLIYSNVQAVNPQLIKKSFENENLSGTIKTSEEEVIVIGKSDEGDILSQKKNESSTLSQSNISVNSDSMFSDLRESFTKYNLSSPSDKFSINAVGKNDIANQVQPFSDTMKYVSSKMYVPNETTSTALSNCESQQADDPMSLHKDVCAEHEKSVFLVKKLSNCESLSSTDLIPSNNATDSWCENSEYEHFLRKRNIQKYIQNICKGKQNNVSQHKIEVGVQFRSSKQKLRKKMKKDKKEEGEGLDLFTIQPNQDELNLKYSQINVISPTSHQDAQSAYKLPLSPFDISYNQKSPQTLCTSRNIYKQLKCVGIQQLRNMSPRKQQILLNCQGDSTTSATIKEDFKLEDSQRTMEDNILEDPVVLFRSMQKQHTPGSKTHFKLSKTDVKHDADVTKVNLVTDKHITDISNNILVKSGIKWTLQNINSQSSKLITNQIMASVDEETPMKRKKLTSNYSSSLETTATVCSTSQEGVQKKHYTSMKKGLICTNGRKSMVDS
ncbi:uncharacterized protein LOC143213246 isoform X2 [Lasioglossum baleicum]|uniref:uncharacterized protein LOC143213246 isoform X2 n=1 Tax=Lasioglossum baleicum TaxID=434251 RepID=UPI003FCCDE76